MNEPASLYTGDPYRVALPQFEGPLDLLLHLIQKHEIDIFDIPIAFITERYLEYVSVLQALDLDLAGEYLLMAATLLHIKSRLLLPSPPPDEAAGDLEGGGTGGEDPRAALVRRLLEYQKFRSAAEELAARGVAGRDVFPRGAPLGEEVAGPAPLAEVPLFTLLEAFERVLRRRRLRIEHEVTAERVSIAQRITEIADLLRVRHTACFEDLFEGQLAQIDLVVTFLAILEMTRLRMTRLYQAGPLEVLWVTLSVTDAEATGDAG